MIRKILFAYSLVLIFPVYYGCQQLLAGSGVACESAPSRTLAINWNQTGEPRPTAEQSETRLNQARIHCENGEES